LFQPGGEPERGLRAGRQRRVLVPAVWLGPWGGQRGGHGGGEGQGGGGQGGQDAGQAAEGADRVHDGLLVLVDVAAAY